MRVVIKGGVWKNTEDEILKVAVMKYGKNQWARISSLLNRKTPKQCKARWYEWLDPSIKKTEWSKEEDEKLLHLAKLMPTQWRTIAPVIGRTPAQCLERYQKLLDEAERELHLSTTNASSSASGGGSSSSCNDGRGDSGPSGDDVRRLRPGEIDPDPEVKPARPDPVDMDEDEKEMLSEARARLANTQGKKAKRKARERQLEESRRLATLQKRRELKAQGITLKPRKPRGDDIDYIHDIPFQRTPLPGFYDTSLELANKSDPRSFGEVLLSQLEGKRRAEREESNTRNDIKRRKLREQQGDPSLAFIGAGTNTMAIFDVDNNNSFSHTRTPLTLPEPQITEHDVHLLSKTGGTQLLISDPDSDLVSDTYSATPSTFRAPMRTPRMAVADSVRAHARAALQAKDLQTPLLGEDQTDISCLPRTNSILPPSQTPNGISDTPRVLMTPSTNYGGYTSVVGTPYRDRMGINTPRNDGFVGPTGTTHDFRLQASNQRSLLKQALQALPKPKNDFQIVLPNETKMTSSTTTTTTTTSNSIPLDQADIDQAQLDQETELRRQRDLLRTQAIQRNLPRPLTLPTPDIMLAESMYSPGSIMHRAEDLITQEMSQLLLRDTLEYPVPGATPVPYPPHDVINDDNITLDQLNMARNLINSEVPNDHIPSVEHFLSSSSYNYNNNMNDDEDIYDPATSIIYKTSELNNPSSSNQSIPSYHRIYEAYVAAITLAVGKAEKLEQKLRVIHGGYINRSKSLSDQLIQICNQIQEHSITLSSLNTLRHDEINTIKVRVADMEYAVNQAKREQLDLQQQYLELSRCKQNVSI